MAAEEDGDVFEITDFTTASDWERFIARLEEVLHEWKLVNRDPLPNAVKGKFTEVVPGASVQFEMCHMKKLLSKYQHLDGLLDMFKGKLGCEYISMPPVSVSVRFTYILEDWIHCPWPQLPPDFSSFSEGEVGCSELDVLPFGACEDPVSELHLSCTWPYLSADMIVETSGYSDLDPLQAPQWSVRIQMTEDPQCLLGQDHRRDLGPLRDGGRGDDGEGRGGEDISNALQRLTEPSMPYHIPSLGTVVSRATTRLKFKPEEAPIPPKLLNKILLHLFPDATGLGGSPTKKNKGQNSQSREDTPLEESPPQGSSDRVEEVFSEALKQLKSCSPDSLTYRLAVSFSIINHNHGGLRAIAHLWQEFVLEMRYRWENSILIQGLGASDQSPSTSSSSHPSPSTPAPNLGSCLLHQKLQMLNCCIERKVKREAAGYGQEGTLLHEAASTSAFETDVSHTQPDNDEAVDEGPARRSAGNSSEDEEEDDEFFECEEGEENEDGEKSTSSDTSPKHGSTSKKHLPSEKSMDSSVSETSFKDAAVMKAEGRLAPMKNLRSLSTNEPLFIPVTQEPSPMTEDMLEEQAEVLARLGSTAQGSQLRARMQSACLLSDMESFKAANPGCCLEDFVRWYSPRDFIEDEEDEEEEEEGGRMGEGGGVVVVDKECEAQQSQPSSGKTDEPEEEEEEGGRVVVVDKEDKAQQSQPSSGKTDELEEEEEEEEEEDSSPPAEEEAAPTPSLDRPEDMESEESQTSPESAGVVSNTDASAADSGSSASKGDGSRASSSHAASDSGSAASKGDNSQASSSQGVSDSGSAASKGDNSQASSSQAMSDSGSSKGDNPPVVAAAPLSSSSTPGGCVSPWQRRQRPRRGGRLSQRMQIPGNMWVEVWHSARHAPARRQKRLFDDTKEAEKVLHFLAGLRPGDLVLHLLPMLVHASVLKLAEKEDGDIPVLKTLTDQVLSRAVKVTRGPLPLEPRRFEEVVRMVELAETVSSRAQSLKTKFTKDLLEKGRAEEELHKFVSSILQHPEVDVRGGAYGPAGNAIHKLFCAAQKAALMILEEEEEGEGGRSAEAEQSKMNEQIRPASTIHDFPTPSAREYILRAMIPRPAPYSRVLPQRMYCVIVDGDYRLAGAFCSDTTFQ
ncbi:hypothetical protein ACOMHN_008577 [Nucella lapillus]